MAYLSSVGVVDQYLAPSHKIPGTSSSVLTVASPQLSLCFYSPFMDSSIVIHPVYLEGGSSFAFAWPEAKMGTYEEQMKAFGEGKLLRSGDSSAVVVEFVEEFMCLLYFVAALG